MKTDECRRSPPTPLRSALPCFLTFSASYLYDFQIHLRHLLAPFPFWRPLIPLSVALLRCVSFTLARMKNSRRILAHSYLEIDKRQYSPRTSPASGGSPGRNCIPLSTECYGFIRFFAKKSRMTSAHSSASTPARQAVTPDSAASPGKSYTLPQHPCRVSAAP